MKQLQVEASVVAADFAELNSVHDFALELELVPELVLVPELERVLTSIDIVVVGHLKDFP